MIRPLLLGGWLVFGGPLAAQSAAGRWSLQIRGETISDRGDLRIDSLGARLLLESNDKVWLPLPGLSGEGGQVAFRIADNRRLEGSVAGELMTGRLLDGAREIATWQARRIQPGTTHWPVRPRFTVRQLVTGSADTVAHFPTPWHRRILSREALLAEHAVLARDAGFSPAVVGDIAARAQRTMLGFDRDARRAAQHLLEQIAATPAADANFRGLFRTAAGEWRLDLHDVAWQQAAETQGRPVDVAGVLRLLSGVGVPADSSSVVRAMWHLWGRQRTTPQAAATLAATLTPDPATGQRLQPLLSGYDAAEQWWRRAVQWLMTARWLETPAGWRSPVDLVAAFWERDSLALPSIEMHHFGGLQAVPVIGAGPIADLLLQPENAIAVEWLSDQHHREQVLDTWRRLELLDPTPLRVTMGTRTIRVASAAQVARSRLGGFLAGRDAIRIEPAIMPVFAVGTVVHEWQHLLFETARLVGDSASAYHEREWGVELVEANPWLGEGAAEWATDVILAPARAMTPLFALAEMEKRLAIGAAVPEDTHVLGYLLVRAAGNRVYNAAMLRRALERHLHDPAAFAAAVGLDGLGSHAIPRPSTLMVIPEVTFTIDAGVADSATRRLVFPDSALEPQ